MKKIFENFHAAIQTASEMQAEHAKGGWHATSEMTKHEITVTIFSDKKNFPLITKNGETMPYTWRTINTFNDNKGMTYFYTCKYKFEWTKDS